MSSFCMPGMAWVWVDRKMGPFSTHGEDVWRDSKSGMDRKRSQARAPDGFVRWQSDIRFLERFRCYRCCCRLDGMLVGLPRYIMCDCITLCWVAQVEPASRFHEFCLSAGGLIRRVVASPGWDGHCPRGDILDGGIRRFDKVHLIGYTRCYKYICLKGCDPE